MSRILPVCLLSLLLGSMSAVQAADFTVTRLDDPSSALCLPGNCSLRGAVLAAASPGAHRILLPPGIVNLQLGALELSSQVQFVGNASNTSSISATGSQPILRVLAGGQVEVRSVILDSTHGTIIELGGTSSLRLERVSQIENQRVLMVDPAAQADLTIVDSFLRALVICGQLGGHCRVEGSTIGSLIVGGPESRAEAQLRRCTIQGTPGVHPLLSGLIVNGLAALSMEDCEVRNSLRPLALYQNGAVGQAPPVSVRRSRFVGNQGPLRGSRRGLVQLEEVWIHNHAVDPNSGFSTDYTQAPSVLLAEEGPDWQILRSAIRTNFGVASDGRTVLLNPGGRVLLDNVYFEHNTRVDGLGTGISDGIGVYAGPGQAPRLRILHSTILRSNLIQVGGVGPVFGLRGALADVRFDNTAINGVCNFPSPNVEVAGQGNVVAMTSCGLDAAHNFTQVTPALIELEPFGFWGGPTPSRPPTAVSALVGRASPVHCSPRDQRGALRPANGVGCDVGSVQHNVAMPMFADGFE
ncbi:MAG: hypothetical protein MEQ07_01205 [Aquimonas sp.]|nr:hypothetical protein [Aquimonas sp.]